MELISQGISNIGSALFGGLPATGTIARTTANVRAGAATPIAAMCHAVLLLVMLLFLTDSIAQIPMASLAGVLIYVAYRMAEWTHVAAQIRSSRSDMLCVLTTFLLTILVGLVTAIVVGTTLSIAQKQLAKIRNQAK
jgi:sulfate permease, SulP family